MNKFIAAALGAAVVISSPAIAQNMATSAAAGASPTAKPAPVDPTALAIAHQILAIGMPPEKRSLMFGSIMDSINDQARKNVESLGLTKDKDLQAVMDRSTQRMWDEMKPIMNAALPDIFESMARAYAREFSTDDLNALLAFVKTPAGQRFFERSPMILKDPDVQAANQRMGAKLLAKLPQIMQENVRDIEDYAAKKKQEKPTEKTPLS